MHTRVILGSWVALIMLLAGCSSNGTRTDLPSSDGTSSDAPLVACKNAVKAELKNSVTDSFSILGTNIDATSFDGTLIAANASGVEQNLKFHCKMSGVTVTSVEVLPIK